MMQNSSLAWMVGAFAIAGAALFNPAPAKSAEALPAAMERHLDEQPAAFTASAAHERRMEIIRNTQRQQRYQARGGYGRGGYAPRRDYGYGRGYGPRPGYGYRRGYDRY